MTNIKPLPTDHPLNNPKPENRFWKWLGFGKPAHPRFEPDENPGMSPTWITTEAHIGWTLADRLRFLISGQIAVAVSFQTEIMVNSYRSKVSASILPPGVTDGRTAAAKSELKETPQARPDSRSASVTRAAGRPVLDTADQATFADHLARIEANPPNGTSAIRPTGGVVGSSTQSGSVAG